MGLIALRGGTETAPDGSSSVAPAGPSPQDNDTPRIGARTPTPGDNRCRSSFGSVASLPGVDAEDPGKGPDFMRCVVTGAAGFIGSHLCEYLLALGHPVAGIDSFIPYYPPEVKRRNLAASQARPDFRFAQLDLRADTLDPL